MLVDMHLHECTYSSDSKISLEEIVTTARGRGLEPSMTFIIYA